MARTTLGVLLVMLFAGALGLAPGTRTLTDVKGPVFAAGAMILALGVFLEIFRRGRLSPSPGRRGTGFCLVAAAYLAFTALSSLWASHPWAVKYALAERLLALVLAVSVGAIAAGGRYWRTIAAAYGVLGAVVSLFTLTWHGIMPVAAPSRFVQRLNDVRAPLGNANLLGAFLILPIAFTAALVFQELREKRRRRVLLAAVVALALNLVVFVLCRSLSGWIGLAVFAAVLAVLKVRRKAALALAGLFCGVAFVLALWFAGGFDLFRRTRTYLERAEYWRRAAVMAGRKPLLGWGAGNFFTDNQPLAAQTISEKVLFRQGGRSREVPLYEVLRKYLRSSPRNEQARHAAEGGAAVFALYHPSSPHNEYLQHAAEGGMAGLALYGAVILVPVWSALRARRSGFKHGALLESAVAAYAAFLATNFLTMNMHFADFAPHFWILAGMLVSAGARRPSPPEGPSRHPKALVRAVTAVAAAAALWGVYAFAIQDYRSSIAYKRGEDLYRSRRSFSAAATAFKKASRLTWDANLHIWSQRMLGGTYLASGSAYLPSACLVFNKLDEKVAAYVDVELAEALGRSGFYERAVEHYRRHLATRPWDEKVKKRVRFLEAVVALRGGRHEEGVAAAGRYFRLNPDDLTARRIYLKELLEVTPANIPELKAAAGALDTPQKSPGDSFLIGRARLVQGDAEGAIDLLENAKRSGYSGPGSNYYRALAYTTLGRLEDARRVIKQGRKVNPTCKSLLELEKRLDELMKKQSPGP